MSIQRYLDYIDALNLKNSSHSYFENSSASHGDNFASSSFAQSPSQIASSQMVLPIELLTSQIIQASSINNAPSFVLRGSSSTQTDRADSIEIVSGAFPLDAAQSAEQSIAALERLNVDVQVQIAQQLCQLILDKKVTCVRPECLLIEGSNIRLVQPTTTVNAPLDDRAIVQALIEMKDSFKALPSFHIAALNAIALFNDRGIENPEELFKLLQLKELLLDPTATKEDRLQAYTNLHKSLRQLFQTLVWASNRKPQSWHQGYPKFLIGSEPRILMDTNGFQKQSLIDQVIDIVTLTQKVHQTKEKLRNLRELLTEGKQGTKIFVLLNESEEKCLPLVELLKDKMREVLRREFPSLTLAQVTSNKDLLPAFCRKMLELNSPYSPLCMIDELDYALQLMQEELTTYAIGQKHVHLDSYSYEQFPARITSRGSVDASRFNHELPPGKPFRVAMISYELAVEGLKYGGLGEAVHALSKNLVASGVQVSVITPRFSGLLPHFAANGSLVEPKDRVGERLVPQNGVHFSHFYNGAVKVDRYYHKVSVDGIDIYYLGEEFPVEGHEHYEIAKNTDLYLDSPSDPREEWLGLKERMAYFSSASIGLINQLNRELGSFDAAVIHDWHGAVALKNLVPTDMGLVYAAHNHHYQGEYYGISAEIAQKCGAPKEGMNAFLEALKIVGHVVPVSLSYAIECQMFGSGAGVEGPVRAVAHDGRLSGIANGSNPDSWNPATNPHLRNWRRLERVSGGVISTGMPLDLTYSSESPDIIEKKQIIKEQLQLAIEFYYPEAHAQFGTDLEGDKPLFLFVGRYDSKQKGLDKFLTAYEAIHKLGGCLITMGIGEDEEAVESLDALELEVLSQQGQGNAWITRGRNDQTEAQNRAQDLYHQNNFSMQMQQGLIDDESGPNGKKPGLGGLIRAAADFVLFPSSFEPCGLVQFEGWLFGSLAIGTRTGGLADTFVTDPTSPHFNGFNFERVIDWKSTEQEELMVQSINEAHAYWKRLDDEEKTRVMQNLMHYAQNSSWTKTPDGSMTPVQKWINVMIESKRHAWLQKARVGNPPLEDSLLTPLQATKKRDGFYPHNQLYRDFGAHLITTKTASSSLSEPVGVQFKVLAPHAISVDVLIRGKDEQIVPMGELSGDNAGVWEVVVPGLGEGSIYEYIIKMPNGKVVRKSDPFAVESLLRPEYASVVRDAKAFQWSDGEWMAQRAEKKFGEFPLSIYQVELGSYQRNDDDTFKTYEELTPHIVAHCKKMGYTHVELLGIIEHPVDELFDNAISGLFSCTSRFGTLQGFQYLVDTLHANNIGIVLNWSPFDFVPNEESLGRFDGHSLYENPDPINGVAPFGRKTHLFNFQRQDVRNFVISGARYACEHWHIDGFRLNTAGLLLDLKRGKDLYRPEICNGSQVNPYGRDFLGEFNSVIEGAHPGVFRIAENFESLGLGLSRAELGFNALTNYSVDPNRAHELWTIPAFSHAWRREIEHSFAPANLANTKLLLSTMMLSPGWGYIMFMGVDYGREESWTPKTVLNLIDHQNEPHHDFLEEMVLQLNTIYKNHRAFWNSSGFMQMPNPAHNVTAFGRSDPSNEFLVIHNYNTEPFEQFQLPEEVKYVEVFNTDLQAFGGQTSYNRAFVETMLRIAPLSTVLLQRTG